MADLAGGDPDAARAVVDRYARRLAAVAAARLPAVARSKVDPEDVAQSVFRTFFRRHKAGQFHPEHRDALWALLLGRVHALRTGTMTGREQRMRGGTRIS
jgi:hypothetical protein